MNYHHQRGTVGESKGPFTSKCNLLMRKLQKNENSIIIMPTIFRNMFSSNSVVVIGQLY